jgi:hypothetical protein
MNNFIQIPRTFFIDGTKIVEQVAGLRFVVYDTKTGETEFQDYYHSDDVIDGKQVIYIPLKNQTITYGQITFADAPWLPENDYPITFILDEIIKRSRKYLYIAPEEETIFKIQVLIAISSWFLDSIFPLSAPEKIAGLIGIVGTSGGGKKRFLTLMREIAYRPVYVLNTTKIPSLFRLVEPWGNATLCIDEADQKDTGSESEIIQFLNGRYDGTPIPRYNSTTQKNDIFRSFGLTIIALRRMPKDEGLASRLIKINATISPIELPEVADTTMSDDFRDVRNYLLYLRLKYYNKLKFINKTGLPVEHSWRGREALTLIKTLAQVDPKLNDVLYQFSEELTRREVINLSQTWDGVILNEIYNFITDENVNSELMQNGIIFYKEYHNKNDEIKFYPLNLSYLSEKLREGASEIKRSLVQFKIDVIERAYLNGGRFRGILLFKYPTDINRIFMRYVPEYEKGYILNVFDKIKFTQSTLDQNGTHGPDGTPIYVSEGSNINNNINNNIIKENNSNNNYNNYNEPVNNNSNDIHIAGPSVPYGPCVPLPKDRSDFYLDILNKIKINLKFDRPKSERIVEREFLNVKNFIKYTFELNDEEVIEVINYWQLNNLIKIINNEIILTEVSSNDH